jgi:hypothetical protein
MPSRSLTDLGLILTRHESASGTSATPVAWVSVAASMGPRSEAAFIVLLWTSGNAEPSVFPVDKVWRNREAHRNSEYIPIWPDTIEETESNEATTLLTGIDAWDFIQEAREKTLLSTPNEQMPSQLSLQSFYHIARVNPGDVVSCPPLYIAAEVDKFTGPPSLQKEGFAKAGTLKFQHPRHQFVAFCLFTFEHPRGGKCCEGLG